MKHAQDRQEIQARAQREVLELSGALSGVSRSVKSSAGDAKELMEELQAIMGRMHSKLWEEEVPTFKFGALGGKRRSSSLTEMLPAISGPPAVAAVGPPQHAPPPQPSEAVLAISGVSGGTSNSGHRRRFSA